jgi:hypothetical protein
VRKLCAPHVYTDNASGKPCGTLVLVLHLRIVARETENHDPSGLESGSARVSWLHLDKDNRNAWNHFTRHFDPDVAGSNADVASQQKLGLRTKRRSGTGRPDHRYSAAPGPDLIERQR